MATQVHAILSCLDPFVFLTPFALEEKPFGLNWNRTPGTLASQVTALTTRPRLLGPEEVQVLGIFIQKEKSAFSFNIDQTLQRKGCILILSSCPDCFY